MDNIIYANGFRVSIGGLETQLMFKLESPVIDENDNISGVSLKDVRYKNQYLISEAIK